MPKTNGLTIKQEAFCQNYAISGNATGAYIRAGYRANGHVAEVEAAKLLRNPVIQARVRELQAERSQNFSEMGDRLIKELEKMAFVSALDVLVYIPNENGEGGQYQLKSPEEIDDTVRAAIQEIKFNRFGVSVKFHDKLTSLDRLARILGLVGGINDAIAILRKYGLHLIAREGKWELMDAQLSAAEVDPEQLESSEEDIQGASTNQSIGDF